MTRAISPRRKLALIVTITIATIFPICWLTGRFLLFLISVIHFAFPIKIDLLLIIHIFSSADRKYLLILATASSILQRAFLQLISSLIFNLSGCTVSDRHRVMLIIAFSNAIMLVSLWFVQNTAVVHVLIRPVIKAITITLILSLINDLWGVLLRDFWGSSHLRYSTRGGVVVVVVAVARPYIFAFILRLYSIIFWMKRNLRFDWRGCLLPYYS